MTVAENGSPFQYSILPAKRKCCKLCEKFVYLHQPILLCNKCENVFHGACLKLKNFIIFDLQRTTWNCNDCARDNNLKCNSCCTSIFVSHEKFNICKNRCMIHKINLHFILSFRGRISKQKTSYFWKCWDWRSTGVADIESWWKGIDIFPT